MLLLLLVAAVAMLWNVFIGGNRPPTVMDGRMVSYSFLQMAVRPSGNIAETRAMTKMSMGERERRS